MQWREVDGYDWCVIETPETGPYLNLTLGYGLVHEPLDQFGTLQQLAGMLQAELSRPVEIGFGRAAVPEVRVTVRSDTTTIAMRGEVVTLSGVWQRLAEIMAGRQPLEPAEPVSVAISAAPRDLTTRFGMTSLTLAASQITEIETQADPLVLLGHLNPAAGKVRAVMCTNTEQLVSSAFDPPAAGSVSGPERSRYRADARSGGMEFRAGYPLVSVLVPSSADGDAAVRLLAQQTMHHTHEVTRRELDVEVSFTTVGPDLLATIMVAGTILYGRQRSQIQQLLVSKPIPDHHIAEATDFEVEHRQLHRILARRVHGLNDDFASVEATQQALAQAHSTIRFFTDPQSHLPAGYAPLRQELPMAEGAKFKGKRGRDALVVGTDVLALRRDGGRGGASEIDGVDLNNLVLVMEDPADSVVLIDDQARTVDIVFDIYRRHQRLRELVTQRTAGVPRITAHNVVPAARIRQQVKQSQIIKWAVALVPVAIIGFAVVMSWLDNFNETGAATPQPTEAVEIQASAEPEVLPLGELDWIAQTAPHHQLGDHR